MPSERSVNSLAELKSDFHPLKEVPPFLVLVSASGWNDVSIGSNGASKSKWTYICNGLKLQATAYGARPGISFKCTSNRKDEMKT